MESEGYSNDGAFEDSRSSDDALSPDVTDDSNMSDISSPPALQQTMELPTSFAKSLGFPAQITFNQDSKVTLPLTTSAFTIPNQSGRLTFAGAFNGTGFVTPRTNVTVTTINNNKLKPKKPKPKPTPKAKVIKFHEYKGPPNVVKSTAPVSTSTTTVIGNPAVSAPVQAAQVLAKPPLPAQPGETPYHILLQQQQLFLQWQLEFNQKNQMNAVIVGTTKEGQPAVMTPASLKSSLGSSLGSTIVVSTSAAVSTHAPTHTVFTVTPSSQAGTPATAQVQQIRIASPVLTPVKQEPQVGQPQPQMNPSMSPVINAGKLIKRPTVTIAQQPPPKFYTSLEEMKVPELKAELKKRNLTVSGQKPKLIERLRPYADAILKTPIEKSPSGSVTSPGSSVVSPTGSVISSKTASPQPFSVISPPGSVTSPPSLLVTSKTPAFSQHSQQVLSSAGPTMTLPVVLPSPGTFSQPGSVQSAISNLKSPQSVSSPASVSNSVLGRSESVMSPVGSVIDEILCANAESPLASIQSMQSAVSVSNMTLMQDDLSNPFSPPQSPLFLDNVMTPLSPDLMDTNVHSPMNAQHQRQEQTVQILHQSNSNQQLHNSMNGNMEQSRPSSVLSTLHPDNDRIDMDIDLDLTASTSSGIAPSFPNVSHSVQVSQPQSVSNLNPASTSYQLDQEVLKSQDDQQQMLNHIQAQLKILQEKQQQKQQQQQQQQLASSSYQLSQEEMLRQQQEKIEKLQSQLQESQLQLQQLQHQQQQQKLQLLQQQISQQQQQQKQQVAAMQQQISQQLQGQTEGQKPVGQPQVLVQVPVSQQTQVQLSPQHMAANQPQSQPATSTPVTRQITVQVPRTTVTAHMASTVTPAQTPQNTTPGLGQQRSAKPATSAPQVMFSLPNGTKTPALGSLGNMKQIQIPASWLTNIQSTPHGMSAVIVPQPTSKKTKPPSLEFIKNQAMNQTLNLGPGKSLIAVSNGTGGVPQFIIATAPHPKTSTAAATSTAPQQQPINGLAKPQQQKM